MPRCTDEKSILESSAKIIVHEKMSPRKVGSKIIHVIEVRNAQPLVKRDTASAGSSVVDNTCSSLKIRFKKRRNVRGNRI